MGAFAVVRDIEHIDQLGHDLGSFAAVLRATSDPTFTEGLFGVWIENTPAGRRGLTTPIALSHGADAAVNMTVEIGGKWAVCVTAPSVTCREDLLTRLEGHGAGGPQGLFVPVFPSDAEPRLRDREWSALANRFPGRVLPLMVQEPSGRLTYDAPAGFADTARHSTAVAV